MRMGKAEARSCREQRGWTGARGPGAPETSPRRRESDPAAGEPKRDKSLAVAIGFILLLMAVVGVLDKPPEENREAVTAASAAAAQAYEREIARHGDELAARWASQQMFEEVLEQWD